MNLRRTKNGHTSRTTTAAERGTSGANHSNYEQAIHSIQDNRSASVAQAKFADSVSGMGTVQLGQGSSKPQAPTPMTKAQCEAEMMKAAEAAGKCKKFAVIETDYEKKTSVKPVLAERAQVNPENISTTNCEAFFNEARDRAKKYLPNASELQDDLAKLLEKIAEWKMWEKNWQSTN